MKNHPVSDHARPDPWWYSTGHIFVVAYGLWTVLCQITVFVGGNLPHLTAAYVSTGFVLLVWRRYKKSDQPTDPVSIEDVRNEPAPRNSNPNNAMLIVLVLAAMVMSLAAHRPDIDDSRYINRAVSAADHPTEPLLRYDHQHSIKNVPIRLTSRLISNEILAAALSLVTGIPAIYFFHLVFPPIFAALAILAYAMLFRILSPKYWIWGVLAVVVVLAADGGSHRSYGNFSFVRLHQGKGVLVSVMTPLIIFYAFRFIKRPTGRRWILLSLSQVAAVGVSSTGLMAAPVISVLSLAAGLDKKDLKSAVKYFLLGLMASAYIVALGGWVRMPVAEMHLKRSRHSETPIKNSGQIQKRSRRPKKRSIHTFDKLEKNARLVFGDGRFAVFYLTVLLTAWIWAENRYGRGLCLFFPIVLGIIFFIPTTAGFVFRYLIRNHTIDWRIFWLLPLPAMAGITMLAPLSFRKLPLKSEYMRFGLYVVLLILVLGVVSDRHIFSSANLVEIQFPGLKVTPGYKIARFINDYLEDRPNIMAPVEVTAWLTTMHGHPYPLVSRYNSNSALLREARDRIALKKYISGIDRPEGADEHLAEGLRRYRVALVCVPLDNPWLKNIIEVLQSGGFEKLTVFSGHEFWIVKERMDPESEPPVFSVESSG